MTLIMTWSCTKKKATEPFYSHHIFFSQDIAYGEHPKQKLDVFYRGSRTGEPNWVSVSDSLFPVVLYIHGGGWIANDKANGMSNVLGYITRGFNVVNMNYRLGQNTAPQAVEDVMHVLKWIDDHAERYRFDTSRVIITGTSAGAHLSLIGGLLNNSGANPWKEYENSLHIRAVVNWYGITDIAKVEHYLQGRKRGSNYARVWIGDTTRIDDISRKFSPANFIKGRDDLPAIITVHGKDDTVVPFEQARQLHKLLEQAGAVNKLMPMPGGNHGGFTDAQYKQAYRHIFDFLQNQGVY